MVPSVRDIRQAATKKRKAREHKAPAEKKAITKVPRRADAEGTSTRKAEAEANIFRNADAREADAKKAEAEAIRKADAKEAGVENTEAQATVAKEADAKEAGAGKAEATPIVLIDPSPEQATRAPSPTLEAAEAGPSHSTTRPVPAAFDLPMEMQPGASPPAKAPEVPGSEAESSRAAQSAEGKEIDPSFQSVLANYSRWAEETLGEASASELQVFLRRQKRSTFFREAAVALLWNVNSFIAMRDTWVLSDVAMEEAIKEMDSLRGKAERAEMALEDTRASVTRALKKEVEANRLRAEKAEEALEVAQRQAANELDNAQVAEGKLEVAELEMQKLKDQLYSATIEIKVARERANNAEEASRRSDIRVAEFKVALTEADNKFAEAEKKIIEAEERASDVEKKIAKAVEDFRGSDAFNKELAESTAFAYESGFQDCKDKIRRLYTLEGIDELEPDEVPEDDGVAPSDS